MNRSGHWGPVAAPSPKDKQPDKMRCKYTEGILAKTSHLNQIKLLVLTTNLQKVQGTNENVVLWEYIQQNLYWESMTSGPYILIVKV